METKKEEKKSGKTDGAALQVVHVDKTLADAVLAKVRVFTASRDLRLPPDYSPENALKSGWLILLETKTKEGKPVLEACTKDSIANALLKMILLGLSPQKGQCDFIAYGSKLSCDVSYFGTLALAKRTGGVEDVIPTVIYEGDVFEYEIINGRKRVTKHVQAFENVDMNKIKGAYATVFFQDPQKEPYVEIMTMAQIRQAWMQGATKGASPAHKNFPDQMSAKTAIGRACKLFINASDDSDLGVEDPEVDGFTQTSREKAAERANKEELTMDIEAEVVTGGNGKKPEPKPQKPKDPPQEKPKDPPQESLFEEAQETPEDNPGF